jgi:prepilin-type N-terminal cleavage/methylation domain-containing protein
MKTYRSNRGFTLIELLLVIGIVAIILAVIVPLGLRARIDAKYGVVRQNASELASFSSQWVEKSIQAQDESTSTATVKNYYGSLAGVAASALPPTTGACAGEWIATNGAAATNWAFTTPGSAGVAPTRTAKAINGRYMPDTGAGQDIAPEDVVEDIIPPEKAIRNPFTEVNVFRTPNFPTGTNVVAGALALGCFGEGAAGGNWVYFGFAFQGTDNTTNGLNAGAEDTTFHAGMGLYSLPTIRNGVFMGRFN